jgi:hypothetical protein
LQSFKPRSIRFSNLCPIGSLASLAPVPQELLVRHLPPSPDSGRPDFQRQANRLINSFLVGVLNAWAFVDPRRECRPSADKQ